MAPVVRALGTSSTTTMLPEATRTRTTAIATILPHDAFADLQQSSSYCATTGTRSGEKSQAKMATDKYIRDEMLLEDSYELRLRDPY